ncbi:MAG: pyridoxamine 5'-phosphate oxidase [Deltaproteobacteria bacterium]|nr:pyridoxamine 5'-phosphate oxidase [Deltaproteobacteria bacterium]
MFKGKDPFKLLHHYLSLAKSAEIPLYEAMTLATASRSGRPSARMVLLKESRKGAVSFFTNYDSRKARELKANPRVALVFFWQKLDIQIRIEGRVKQASASESDAYWKTRPFESQISGAASKQSRALRHRDELLAAAAELRTRYGESRNVPRPKFWGGYHVVPDRFEFWLGKPNRLHERHQFSLSKSRWRYEELSP